MAALIQRTFLKWEVRLMDTATQSKIIANNPALLLILKLGKLSKPKIPFRSFTPHMSSEGH